MHGCDAIGRLPVPVGSMFARDHTQNATLKSHDPIPAHCFIVKLSAVVSGQIPSRRSDPLAGKSSFSVNIFLINADKMHPLTAVNNC